jgi:hypothetical protein
MQIKKVMILWREYSSLSPLCGVLSQYVTVMIHHYAVKHILHMRISFAYSARIMDDGTFFLLSALLRSWKEQEKMCRS